MLSSICGVVNMITNAIAGH